MASSSKQHLPYRCTCPEGRRCTRCRKLQTDLLSRTHCTVVPVPVALSGLLKLHSREFSPCFEAGGQHSTS